MQTKTSRKKTKVSKVPTLQELETYLSITEVAEQVDRDRVTVFRWIKSGRLPATKAPFGGMWLVNPADLADFEPPEVGNPDWIAKR